MIMKNIKEVLDSYQTYDQLYEKLEKSNFDDNVLTREMGRNNYPEIQWMMEYFTSTEQYEKCVKLLAIKFSVIDDSFLKLEQQIIENLPNYSTSTLIFLVTVMKAMQKKKTRCTVKTKLTEKEIQQIKDSGYKIRKNINNSHTVSW